MTDQLPMPLPEPGAASILTYASERETIARKDWETSEEVLKKCLKLQRDRPAHLDGVDFDGDVSIATTQRDSAFSRWKEAADMVYKFDKSVSPEKRDATERMTREEITALLSMFWIYERQGTSAMVHALAPALRLCTSEAEIFALSDLKFWECKRNALETARGAGHLPEWLIKTLEGVV